MNIANNDILYQKLKNSVNNSNKIFIDKFKEAKRRKDENEYLNMIYNEFLKHYEIILNEKYKTETALTILFRHLENIEKHDTYSKEQSAAAKYEKKELIKKINHIKNEIETLAKID
tara:strand:- start:644 stop:991 length:348 start_codon:yes stop_codon:yes gene_type:complete